MKMKPRWHRVLVGMCCLPWLAGFDSSRAGQASELEANSARVNSDTGYVAMLRGRIDVGQSGAGSEAAARGFLRHYAESFGLRSDLADLRIAGVTEDVGGRVVRFEQDYAGVSVFEGDVVVGFDSAGAVVHVTSGYLPGLELSTAPTIRRDRAVLRAGEVLGAWFAGGGSNARLVVVRGDKRAPGVHLAWEVQGFLAAPLGDWHVFVDATTGEPVRVIDLLKRTGPACVPCNPPATPNCGRVFHQNPVSQLQNTGLRDSDNVDAAQQGCALQSLISPLQLDGLFANTNITAARVGPPYSAFRSANQQAVDEVNVYYHANRAKEYLNILGYPGVMNFSISIDAHDATLGDNAHYVPSTKILEFGEGGVDNAQDPSVIYHEYGHAIQDNQVPGYGITDEGGAAGEGFGDYFGAALSDESFAAALGPACLGPWDATAYNPYTGTVGSGCLRRLDGTKQYPRDMNFEVHDDGEIWSSALWSLRGAVGAAVADSLIIKSHTFLTASANFLDAADAVLSADQALYGGIHATAIHDALRARGIPRTGIPAPPVFSVSVPFHCETNHNYANLEYKECRFTQPGATRLRFHFTAFNTELGYDYTYISDGNYLQVQALSGTPFGLGAGYSAAVQGDTIVARFKADSVVTRLGFTLDRVEYDQLAPPPAGRVPDGGPTPGIPLIASRDANGGITLKWSASCASTDDDYEIYEGMLGAFTSHVPVVCSTDRLTILTVPPSPGNRYYLVVPRNLVVEGSYGRRGDGTERPTADSACAAQNIAASCP